MQTTDDHLTFLLPRPIWVNDIDVSNCTSCTSAFGHLRRRHHCRHWPVRVCNDCFEVAYLVTYAIDEDHGLTTQIHGARGLLELTEKGEEKDLHNMVAYGGIDALIWLCRTSTNTEIHHLLTTNLAMLAEKESIRPVIITKWALPPLLQLLQYYMHSQQTTLGNTTKKLPSVSIDSASLSRTGTQSSTLDAATKHLSIDDIDYYTVHLEIIINCTHVIYQLAKAGILSQEEIIAHGVLETLFSLTRYKIDDLVYSAANGDLAPPSEKHQQQQNVNEVGQGAQEQWKERESIIQGLAAKSVSFVGSTVSNQASMIEQLRSSNNLALALISDNDEVKKYIAKTVAYLSLRNDKYKPILLGGDKVRALLSVLVLLPQSDSSLDDSTDLRKSDIAYYLSLSNQEKEEESGAVSSVSVDESDHAPYTAAVSHICCALANFATNHESQVILMTQPRLLQYICNVPSLFSSHLEIHRHVARCLANLALYDENNEKMLNSTTSSKQLPNNDSFNVIPTILAMGQSANATSDIRRHIIRALDNLSSNGLGENEDNKRLNVWKSMWQDIQPLIESIMQLTTEEDTLKRARSILERFQHYLTSTAEDDHDDQQKQDSNDRSTGSSVDDETAHDDSIETAHDDSIETAHDDSTETDQHETGPPKVKSNKKNKKKKNHA
ncbi:hypothetical protein [Absidia glauca]|uniref:FYVE zinc finger domain-containing protein n=1 Tax=Absidia glauca TaxID=4829 RepID=A0A168RW28_ABSGL|nr:hypothetical protein [Absidia glauca]